MQLRFSFSIYEKNKKSKSTNHLELLLDIYNRRPDLQSAFPEVNQSNLRNLIEWAKNVVTNTFEDHDFSKLIPHGPRYVYEAMNFKIEELEKKLNSLSKNN